jgi:protoporphyrinogen oxidase
MREESRGMKTEPHVVIIGAGPAGLGAAFQLIRKKLARVTVIEQSDQVGGIAGSFEISGVHVDYGSHRLHPSCDLEIMQDIKALLNDDLLDRPRHGRIRLCGRWIHFPLKPLDLMLRLSPGFSAGVMMDAVTKALRMNKASTLSGEETFASVLEAGLGRTVCKNFYFPYTRKLWGLPPERLSSIQAHRRVSSNSLSKMFRKILTMTPFVKKNGAGRFFYPRKGFGEISERLYRAALQEGAEVFLGAQLRTISINGDHISSVRFEQDGNNFDCEADFVWSTVPMSDLLKSVEPSPPADILEALSNIKYRSMILIYLVLEQSRFSEYDAHYFPEQDIAISRMSEPKNYSDTQKPNNITVLCAELPCTEGDSHWNMTDQESGDLVRECLERSGIPVKSHIREVITRRLKHAYPIFEPGYEKSFNMIDKWLSGVYNLLSFGRQGLFVHDNIHLSLYNSYAAVNCFNKEGSFDRARWEEYRKIFDAQVVED